MTEYEILYKTALAGEWKLYFRTKDAIFADSLMDEIRSTRPEFKIVKIVEVRRRTIKTEYC